MECHRTVAIIDYWSITPVDYRKTWTIDDQITWLKTCRFVKDLATSSSFDFVVSMDVPVLEDEFWINRCFFRGAAKTKTMMIRPTRFSKSKGTTTGSKFRCRSVKFRTQCSCFREGTLPIVVHYHLLLLMISFDSSIRCAASSVWCSHVTLSSIAISSTTDVKVPKQSFRSTKARNSEEMMMMIQPVVALCDFNIQHTTTSTKRPSRLRIVAASRSYLIYARRTSSYITWTPTGAKEIENKERII